LPDQLLPLVSADEFPHTPPGRGGDQLHLRGVALPCGFPKQAGGPRGLAARGRGAGPNQAGKRGYIGNLLTLESARGSLRHAQQRRGILAAGARGQRAPGASMQHPDAQLLHPTLERVAIRATVLCFANNTTGCKGVRSTATGGGTWAGTALGAALRTALGAALRTALGAALRTPSRAASGTGATGRIC
jgi:hypothetical protein